MVYQSNHLSIIFTYFTIIKNLSMDISILHLRWIKFIASEVFNLLKTLNPEFMNEMFEVKDVSYII